MSKSILITGSTGFIGSYILAILLKKKYKVFKLVRNKKLKNDEFFYDLNDPNSILSLKDKIKVDVIIHFSAYVSFNKQNLNEIYHSNILGTACLISLAKIWNAKFIFASTALVHGSNNKKINIKSKIVNDHPYTHSKWLGEKIIFSSGIDNCILRIGGVYGLNGPRHLGLNNSINSAINGITPSLSVKDNIKRNYIYVKDAALFVLKIVENNISGIHYLSSSEVLTIKEMTQMICEVFLKNKKPYKKEIKSNYSQIIEPSELFKYKYTFKKALLDIKRDFKSNNIF